MSKVSSVWAGTLALAIAGCGGSSSLTASNVTSGSGGGRQAGVVFLQDAPPADIIDNLGTKVFTMHELWLTISGAVLVEKSGAAVPLTLVTSPVVVDVMTLDTASQVLAVGSYPAGTYEELKLTITGAEMVGFDFGGQPATVQLQHQGEFEAEFKPGAAFLDPAQGTPIIIDWQPSVTAITGIVPPTSFTLEDEVHAFVPGSGGGAAHPTEIEGTIAALDCAGGTLTISHHGALTQVALTGSTQFEDDDDHALPNGCADLAVGHKVEVKVTLPQTQGALPVATKVEDESISTGGGGSGGAKFEEDGNVEGLVTNGSGFIEFDLRVATSIVAHVVTNASTDYELDHGGSTTQTSVQNGMKVEVEGAVLTAGTPPTVVADEIEIK